MKQTIYTVELIEGVIYERIDILHPYSYGGETHQQTESQAVWRQGFLVDFWSMRGAEEGAFERLRSRKKAQFEKKFSWI